MSVKLLTEHYLEFLSLKGGCTGSSEATLVKMPKLLEITCHGLNDMCSSKTHISCRCKLHFETHQDINKIKLLEHLPISVDWLIRYLCILLYQMFS